MTGSLQDQLLKSGLVSEQRVKESRKKKSRQFKKGKQTGKEPSLAEAYAKRRHTDQQDKDRALNERREEARRKKALKDRLKNIIVPAAKNDPKADLPRHFEFAGKIRKLYVTASQQTALNEGKLGVAYHAGRHFLVEAPVIDKLRSVHADAISFFAPDVKTDDEVDDFYAGFEVPDDLQW